MKKSPRIDDSHFRQFAANLEQAIAKYGDVPDDDLTKLQKNQIEKLVGLEKEFRRSLIKHPWGPGVYKAFIRHICDERRNILAARPYFRERQTVFTNQISKVLKKRAERSLYKFHFNYEFILFAMDCYRWRENRMGSRIVALAEEIAKIRTELVEMNLPLAISRARIFWSRTPKSQLSYMDLIQITSMGLMNAIDKFVLPYSPSFRAMAIGRMIGNLIEEYSETLVHFYPKYKRLIYRANKVISRFGENPNWEEVAKAVNEGMDPKDWTTAAEIADLLAAASTVSADSPAGGSEEPEEEGISLPLEGFAADESTHPDVRFERKEAMSVLADSINQLSMMERKLLRMKGVSL